MRSLVTLGGGALVALVVSCSGSPTAPGGGIVSQPTTGGGGTTSQPPNGGGGMIPSGTVVDVMIQDFMFSPATLTIKAGTTVRWTNNGPSAHVVASDMGVWSSGTLSAPMSGAGYGMGDGMGGGYRGGGNSPGGTFQFTFNRAGTYGYHCTIHPPSLYPSFIGTVTVTP